MARLHEIGSSVTPDLTYRIASGKAGVPTVNTTFDDLVDWLTTQLAVFGLTPIVVNIGGWDMDTDLDKTIAHTVPANNEIVSVFITIYNDAGTVNYCFTAGDNTSSACTGGISWDGTNIYLTHNNSFFGNQGQPVGLFHNDAINRGLMKIEYRPI
jgi:hypothetical protein